MSVQESIVTALGATFSDRLYPVMAPETVTLPYAVYQVISQVPSNVLTGTPGLFNSRVQIDIFGRLYSDVQTLKASTRTAMDSSFGDDAKEGITQDLFEEEARLYRVSMDWSVWHN